MAKYHTVVAKMTTDEMALFNNLKEKFEHQQNVTLTKGNFLIKCFKDYATRKK